MKKALVCGGHGFIGHHMALRLKKEGYWVRTIDIAEYEYGKLDVDEYIIGDLRDMKVCKNVLKMNEPIDEVYQFACYDKDTEILTENGWKLFKDLNRSEKVATLQNNQFVWEKPTNYVSYKYNGAMIHFDAKSIDVLVTPNHKMYIAQPHKKDNFHLVEASKCIKTRYWFKTSVEWTGMKKDQFTIKTNKIYRKEAFKKFDFNMNDFLEFLGYYLSEGSTCCKKNGTFVVHLANRDPELIEKMFNVCKRLGYNPYKDHSTSMGVSFCSQVMVDYLKQFGLCTDKFIPKEFKKLSKDQLRILFDSLMAGDGNKDGRTYTTTSKKLCEDFQEMSIKLGLTTTIGKPVPDPRPNYNLRYHIYLSRSKRRSYTNIPIIKQYNDMVYCVEVKDHVILVRRNGKTLWCGNCDMGGAGYIFTGNNDINVAKSYLINSNFASLHERYKKLFYSSSACVYQQYNQTDHSNPICSEDSAYPAYPDSEYGWEKLHSERLYQIYNRLEKVDVRIARFHNVMGPEGSWDNGKEKAPSALCRKVAMAKDGDEIEIWGPGTQTRSFLYIDECLEGIRRLMDSDFMGPVNIGSEEMISINDLAKMIMDIAGKKLTIRNITGPVGVMGRNSDNDLIQEKLGWAPSRPLREGIEKLYAWIESQVKI